MFVRVVRCEWFERRNDVSAVKRTRAQINARNRRAGAAWELSGLKALRELGFDSERLRLSGKQDEGDIAFRHKGQFHVHEYKNVQSWSYSTLLDFLRQAKEEATNFGTRRFIPADRIHHAVVVKQHGKGWTEGVVMMPVHEYLRLIGEAEC